LLYRILFFESSSYLGEKEPASPLRRQTRCRSRRSCDLAVSLNWISGHRNRAASDRERRGPKG